MAAWDQGRESTAKRLRQFDAESPTAVTNKPSEMRGSADPKICIRVSPRILTTGKGNEYAPLL